MMLLVQGFTSAQLHHANRLQFFVGDVETERKEFFGAATGGLCASAVVAAARHQIDFQGRANA
jgi:hypothetical protein